MHPLGLKDARTTAMERGAESGSLGDHQAFGLNGRSHGRAGQRDIDVPM
jgi:hypothetical protein